MFVTDLAAPALDPDDRHHLLRVLRLRPGEEVSVADGQGGWRACTLGADGALEPTSDIVVVPVPAPVITVALAVPKGDRPEWAVQKLTEVGVDRIVILRTDRGVVRWDGDRAVKHLTRLREVARSAARQSRRLRLPTVTGPLPLSSLAAPGCSDEAASAAALLDAAPALALAEPGGAAPSLDRPTIAVGPEGGWSEAELSLGSTVSLGPTVLRSETAAVVAGTLLAALRSGLVR